MHSFISLFILLLSIVPCAWAQTSISLSPTESFLKGAPGSSVSQEFVVINDGAAPYRLNCFFEDVWFDGEKTISGDLGTLKEGQAGYQAQCSPNSVLVPPKYVQKIKVVGLIPKDQTGERFTRFYAQMLPPEELRSTGGNAPKAMIGYSSKIGALLSFTAEGTQKISSEVIGVKIEPTKKYQVLRFQIHNTGNVHVTGSGTLVITDANGQMYEKADVKLPFLYPGQTKSISVNLMDPLKTGKYTALLSVSGSPNEPVFVKEFPIDYKSGK
jgi:hypothetical protein